MIFSPVRRGGDCHHTRSTVTTPQLKRVPPAILAAEKGEDLLTLDYDWSQGALMHVLNYKLEERDILQFILGYDIVWLFETKNDLHQNVPGFRVHAHVSRSDQHRGGVVRLATRCFAGLPD